MAWRPNYRVSLPKPGFCENAPLVNNASFREGGKFGCCLLPYCLACSLFSFPPLYRLYYATAHSFFIFGTVAEVEGGRRRGTSLLLVRPSSCWRRRDLRRRCTPAALAGEEEIREVIQLPRTRSRYSSRVEINSHVKKTSGERKGGGDFCLREILAVFSVGGFCQVLFHRGNRSMASWEGGFLHQSALLG